MQVGTIDSDQKIVVQCGTDGNWHPNIWYRHTATGVADTTQLRYTYCAREWGQTDLNQRGNALIQL